MQTTQEDVKNATERWIYVPSSLFVLEDKTEIWDLPTNNLKHVVHGHQVGFAIPHENSILKE